MLGDLGTSRVADPIIPLAARPVDWLKEPAWELNFGKGMGTCRGRLDKRAAFHGAALILLTQRGTQEHFVLAR